MTTQFLVSTTEYKVVTFRRIEKKEQVCGGGQGHRKKISSVSDIETWGTYRQSSRDVWLTIGTTNLEIRREISARGPHCKVISFLVIVEAMNTNDITHGRCKETARFKETDAIVTMCDKYHNKHMHTLVTQKINRVGRSYHKRF